MTIYLYVKTHRVTGLKYLGKTISTDPYSYPGSGIDWAKHLYEFGNFVDTEILKECQTEEELRHWGKHYSALWNVVESKEWANLKEEDGCGGYWSEASKAKLSKTTKEILAKLTLEEKTARMKNSCCRPDSYTTKRIENMRKGMLGKKKTKTPAFLAAIEARKEQSLKNMLDAAAKNRGRTWKIIDGKRVWMDKETML